MGMPSFSLFKDGTRMTSGQQMDGRLASISKKGAYRLVPILVTRLQDRGFGCQETIPSPLGGKARMGVYPKT